jgi:hypothetical protein
MVSPLTDSALTDTHLGFVLGIPNGVVDSSDYLFWKSHYGNFAAGLGANFDTEFQVNVPEPARMVLFGWGL